MAAEGAGARQNLERGGEEEDGGAATARQTGPVAAAAARDSAGPTRVCKSPPNVASCHRQFDKQKVEVIKLAREQQAPPDAPTPLHRLSSALTGALAPEPPPRAPRPLPPRRRFPCPTLRLLTSPGARRCSCARLRLSESERRPRCNRTSSTWRAACPPSPPTSLSARAPHARPRARARLAHPPDGRRRALQLRGIHKDIQREKAIETEKHKRQKEVGGTGPPALALTSR